MKTGWKRLAEAVRQVHMAAVKVVGGADGQEGETKKVTAPAAADRRAPIRQMVPLLFYLYTGAHVGYVQAGASPENY